MLAAVHQLLADLKDCEDELVLHQPKPDSPDPRNRLLSGVWKVEVVRANGLKPSDSNGLSDPFFEVVVHNGSPR